MIQDSLQHALRAHRRLATRILLLGTGLYLLSGVYSVKNNEVGVCVRFGRVIDRGATSGIHYALPWPIDRVEKVPVRAVQRLAIDDFLAGDTAGTTASVFRAMTQLDSFCVTGDNNVVNVGCAIQYVISDPSAFLFRPTAPETLLRAIACNSMIRCLGAMEVDRALTLGGQRIKESIHTDMNQKLVELGLGLTVVAVDLQPVRPPQPVQTYFDDVVNAKIDGRKAVSQAEADQNERLARARADSARLVQQAEAYRVTKVAEAQGKASRFLSRLIEYRKAPELTRERLYLDLVQSTLSKVPRKVVTDADAAGSIGHMRIVVPR